MRGKTRLQNTFRTYLEKSSGSENFDFTGNNRLKNIMTYHFNDQNKYIFAQFSYVFIAQALFTSLGSYEVVLNNRTGC